MKNLLVGLIAVSLVIMSCISAPPAGAGKEADAEAKQFSPPEGKVNLYIIRPQESPIEQIAFKVFVDDRLVAELNPGTYQLVVAEPGKHRIEVKASYNTARLDITLEAGRNAFYQAATESGSRSAMPQLSTIAFERMGKLSVNQYQRAPILP